ncbi:CCA tRNA nucleotidyltransferase 1, mitochondrial [Chelonus insularis]|uniref:CCA tRNA nucleotidyltransferase 1, mitochondrial n=1 Tax=Chelonus insularis TaxID=460826 RepID=UPI0015890384|nr:CCA tRNA nucleotidyltransferase 1, mitochondrial [Chelonus insularis]
MIFKRLLHKQISSFLHQCDKRFIIHNTSDSSLKWKKIKDFKKAMPPHRENPVVTVLDTPEFRSIFTPELDVVRNLFKKYNYELRIAGGAVRDMLMKITPKDLDFATTATPNQMKEFFTNENIRMINMNGERHGTITVRINDAANFEITTLRIDVVTDGRHADIEFTTDWILDANRRDLTINSMFLDFDGRVYDYFFGYDDLEKRRVAFVGDAHTRITEDFLRILRYFRFYGRIADHPNNHEETTIKAIKDNVSGLERISGERIWTEWSKILEGNFGMELTIKMIECNLGKYIGLPENIDLDNFRQICQRARSNNMVLHPATMIVSMLKDEKEVLDAHGRLKWSGYIRDLALFVVLNRNIEDSQLPLLSFKQLMLTSNKRKTTREYILEVFKYQGKFDLMKEFQEWEVPHFPVKGDDVRSYITNPKMITIVLNALKRIWLIDNCQTSRDSLLAQVPDIIANSEEKYKSLIDTKKVSKGKKNKDVINS